MCLILCKQENERWETISRRLEELERDFDQEDLIYLLTLEDEKRLAALYRAADRVRQKYVGDEVHLRGLIEFSNYCRKNCCYCGIRRDNREIKRYRLTAQEILSSALEAARLGYRTVVLQSGEDPYYTADKLVDLVRRLKLEADVAITLSVGERSRETYERLYQAGADRYLLRFETSNRTLYARLHPDSDYERRMQILTWLKEIGYQVGSGSMVGLPGQTIADLARDILTIKQLDLDMVGLGPYLSHAQTPLAGQAGGTAEMTFKMIALVRIVTRCAHIPATTALATLRPDSGREEALRLGANIVMPNVTPTSYRALYQLYPDKVCLQEEAETYHDYISRQIVSLGRRVGRGYGHSLRNFK